MLSSKPCIIPTAAAAQAPLPQACGSGACAAAAVGIMQGLLDNKVQVDLPGGSLLIEWEGVGSPLYMTGDATHIYDGNIHL